MVIQKICNVPIFSSAIPMTLEDCVSYYEQLCFLAFKINEIIEKLENEQIDFEGMIQNAIQQANEYTDTKVNVEVSELKAQIDAQLAEMENSIEGLEKSLTKEIARLETEIENKVSILYEYIDNGDLQNMTFIQKSLLEMRIWLNSVIGTSTVIDPTTGKVSKLQTALDNIWRKLNYFSVTVLEYLMRNITVKEYEELHLTVEDYDKFGKLYLYPLKWKKYVYITNPVTGHYDKVVDVTQWLINQHRPNAISVAEYTSANLTVGNYASLNLTSYEYNFNAKNHIS